MADEAVSHLPFDWFLTPSRSGASRQPVDIAVVGMRWVSACLSGREQPAALKPSSQPSPRRLPPITAIKRQLAPNKKVRSHHHLEARGSRAKWWCTSSQLQSHAGPISCLGIFKRRRCLLFCRLTDHRYAICLTHKLGPSKASSRQHVRIIDHWINLIAVFLDNIAGSLS